MKVDKKGRRFAFINMSIFYSKRAKNEKNTSVGTARKKRLE